MALESLASGSPIPGPIRSVSIGSRAVGPALGSFETRKWVTRDRPQRHTTVRWTGARDALLILTEIGLELF